MVKRRKMSAIRFAFVGCGGIARHHLAALRGCSQRTQLVAAVDIRKENAEALVSLIPRQLGGKDQCQVSGWGW